MIRRCLWLISLNSPTPLYQQIKDILRHQIERGELEPGSQIPSEREICQRYNLSRTTVRQAINEAAAEGLLYRVQGKGTFVAKPKIAQSLFRMTSFKDTIRARGLTPSIQVLEAHNLPADFETAKLLNIDVHEEITRIVLLGYADREPIVYYHAFLPVAIGKEVAQMAQVWAREGKAFSTYDLYPRREGFIPHITNQTFEAALADKSTAKILGIKVGDPIFIVISITYAKDNRPMEFKRAIYRGDKFKFNIVRQHPLF
ncbi:hypothetical protein SY88_14770 [Clostridiales bacterium PH28_bin88]|nr:hypothetical protein SY88_14770 [Clostridiales bacterium PH28_bin88]